MSFFVDPDVPGLHREVRSHGIASQFSEQTYRHEAIGSMRGVRIGESAPKRHQPPTVVGAHRYMRLNQHALHGFGYWRFWPSAGITTHALWPRPEVSHSVHFTVSPTVLSEARMRRPDYSNIGRCENR